MREPAVCAASNPLPPPFRWPGGKRRLLAQLTPYCPPTWRHYYEPFAGAAALFFHLRPPRATLSDHNPGLIHFYRVLRDDPAGMAAYLERWGTDERTYYRVRLSEPTDDRERAARFMYLTQLAFNGIYRVNRDGKFNTPYGGRQYRLPSEPALLEWSSALHGVDLVTCDFADAVQTASDQDFVYFDPPYTVRHDSNGFRRYNERIYTFEDQIRLANVARGLARRGCRVLLSNAHHESIAALLPDFQVHVISRKSLVSASGRGRGTVREALFYANVEPGLRATESKSLADE